MSSILKALKKLEEEQAGRTGAQSPGRSGGQFVAPMKSRRQLWSILACGLGIGLFLIAIVYLLLIGHETTPLAGQSQTRHAAGPEPVATTPAAALAGKPDSAGDGATRTMQGPEPSSPTGPVATAPKIIPPAGAKPASAKVMVPAPASQRSAPSAAPATAGSASLSRDEPLVVAPQVPVMNPVEQIQVERREIPAAGQQWAAPYLVVSDILPASGGERMAIVNGLPVMEGTMVEDAVVREIRASQVVFEVEGKSIVVPLEKRP